MDEANYNANQRLSACRRSDISTSSHRRPILRRTLFPTSSLSLQAEIRYEGPKNDPNLCRGVEKSQQQSHEDYFYYLSSDVDEYSESIEVRDDSDNENSTSCREGIVVERETYRMDTGSEQKLHSILKSGHDIDLDGESVASSLSSGSVTEHTNSQVIYDNVNDIDDEIERNYDVNQSYSCTDEDAVQIIAPIEVDHIFNPTILVGNNNDKSTFANSRILTSTNKLRYDAIHSTPVPLRRNPVRVAKPSAILEHLASHARPSPISLSPHLSSKSNASPASVENEKRKKARKLKHQITKPIALAPLRKGNKTLTTKPKVDRQSGEEEKGPLIAQASNVFPNKHNQHKVLILKEARPTLTDIEEKAMQEKRDYFKNVIDNHKLSFK